MSLARADLREIRGYLAEHGEAPPKKLRESFEKFAHQVADMPNMYSRYEHNPNYRRAVIEYGYLVFYQVDEAAGDIKVYRVLHGKRGLLALLDV